MDGFLRVLLKIPNVSQEQFAKLNTFIISKRNELPRYTAGPERCVEVLGSERDNKNGGLQVTLLAVRAYHFAGGQHSRKKSPRRIIDALFDSIGIFPKEEGKYH